MLALVGSLAGGGKALTVTPDALEWKQPFGPKGPSIAFLIGQLGDKHPATYFIRFRAGSETGWHIHSSDYEALVVKGTFAAEQQDGREALLPAGSFFSQPARQNHRNRCVEGGDDCVIFIHYPHGADGQATTADGKRLPRR
jgi:quercetin dioxygenase-like cupin family protein